MEVEEREAAAAVKVPNSQGQYKRCGGRIAYTADVLPEHTAALAEGILKGLVHLLLVKLGNGGRFQGFLDPGSDEPGLLWLEMDFTDPKQLPVGPKDYPKSERASATFYMRKGGTRQFSQKQRDQLESDLLQVSDVTGVTMILFINEQGDEHEVYYANAVKGLEPEAEIVSLSAEVAIEVKKYQRGGLIWYELGKRRRRSGGKVKEQGARGGVPDGGQVRAPSPSGDGRKSSLKSSPSSQSANGESDAGQEEAGARWEGQGRVDRMTGAHTEEPPQTGVSDLTHARKHAHTYTHVHARTHARAHTHKAGP